jgi:type I restriction enzyme R subunit
MNKSRDSLRELLSSRQAGGIIFTTVQKFALLNNETAHPVLSKRHNIVVVSDEAHRSQYGDKAKFNAKTGQYSFGYSKHMRDALPKASSLVLPVRLSIRLIKTPRQCLAIMFLSTIFRCGG